MCIRDSIKSNRLSFTKTNRACIDSDAADNELLASDNELLAVRNWEPVVNVSPLVAFTSPVIVTDVAVNAPSVSTLKGAELNVACPNCIPSSASAINTSLLLPNTILLLVVSNEKFVAVKVVVSISKPPIEPDLNTALPFASILADAFAEVDVEPPIVAGVNIELADTEP